MNEKLSVFERRVEMLCTLNFHRKMTIPELAFDFSVSEDTICRDIAFLSRYAPIYILAYKRYIERNQDFLRSLYENLVNHIITQEEYSVMKSDYENKISEAVKKIHKLENETQQQKQEYEKYCDLSDTISEICKNNHLTAALIDKLIDRIDIYKDKSLSIQFSFKNEFCEVNANA